MTKKYTLEVEVDDSVDGFNTLDRVKSNIEAELGATVYLNMPSPSDETRNDAVSQAKAQLSSIVGLAKAQKAHENKESLPEEFIDEYGVEVDEDGRPTELYFNVDDIIQDDPLSVTKSNGYEVLLCTGGPAVRIVGDLNKWNEPASVELQAQGWSIPWEAVPTTTEEDEAMLTYVHTFYFGEA